MLYFKSLIALLVLTVISSCNKDEHSNAECFPNTSTVRQITDEQATVKEVGGRFYIVEQGAIDTKLNPCSLPKDYQVDNLQVTISGEVKSTPQGESDPCCTENFVITNISK